MLLSRGKTRPLFWRIRPIMHARAYRPAQYKQPGRRLGRRGELAERPGRARRVVGRRRRGRGRRAAEVASLASLGELTPDDVHVQVLHGKIDSNDVLTGVTVQDLELAESCVGGRYRFDGPIVSTAAAPSATPCG
jgi:hypothetical protein